MSNIKKYLMLLSLLIFYSQTLFSKNWVADENGVTPTFYLVCVFVVIAFLGGLFIYRFYAIMKRNTGLPKILVWEVVEL